MKRKFLLILSILTLAITFSATAFAMEPPEEIPEEILEEIPEPETYDIWVGGVQVTEENKDNILNAANEADYVSYDPLTSTLTAHTLQIKGADGYGIKALGNLTINVPDDYLRVRNTTVTETGESYGIYCTGSLTLQGNNIIYFVSGEATAKSIGLYCAGDLTLDTYTYVRGTSGEVNNTDDDAVSAGVWVGGKITATDTNEVFGVGNKVKNGTSYGIFAGSDLYLNYSNAHGEVNGYDTAYVGTQQTYGIYVDGNIYAENGSDISALAGWGSSDNYCVYAKGNIELSGLTKISVTLDGNNEALTLGGIRSDKNLTVDYSILEVAADDTTVRKSYGIDVLNLAVRNNSYCSVVSQPAISDSIA
ncbi:MAG: hypothetical protein KBS79_03030, partial [Lachnospiraceae bacterium]|nr:hypothetical protein [Candidatus Minthocola equi]